MEPQIGLNAGGWIFIITAWGFIVATTIFCFKRVLAMHDEEKG